MNKNAFTLLEIIVTTVIVGILGVIAIPNLITMINRSYSQEVMHNLVAIYGAQQNYSMNNNFSYKECNMECINKAETDSASPGLGLSIVSSDSNITYSCTSSPASCSSTSSSKSGDFAMKVSLNKPLKNISSAVYCDGGVPNDTYNPCCTGTGTAGAACP